VKFRAGELEFNANVAQSSEAPSPQTGDLLRSLTIQFRAQKITMHEQALVEAEQRQSGGLYSLSDATNEPEMEWRVSESTSSYVGSEPWGINHHVWRIEQVERLACERLIVGAIELDPYEYAEEVQDGVVRFAARALAYEAELKALSKLEGIVDVVRVGISDTPRQMRLEYVWGERPEALVVVLRGEDALEARVTLHTASPATDPLGELLSLLKAKGVVDEDDLDQLRQRRHAARRVENVDGWSL
jgi:hypothetical protein